MANLKVFQYIEELDAFLVEPKFSAWMDCLGLTEWTPVVWIGRLFTLDNDYGEHWFDNWDEREALEERAVNLGMNASDLMILKPDPFHDGQDGPCHPPQLRRRFWTDVLKSLELSDEMIFAEARDAAAHAAFPDDLSPDEVERRIAILLAEQAE